MLFILTVNVIIQWIVEDDSQSTILWELPSDDYSLFFDHLQKICSIEMESRTQNEIPHLETTLLCINIHALDESYPCVKCPPVMPVVDQQHMNMQNCQQIPVPVAHNKDEKVSLTSILIVSYLCSHSILSRLNKAIFVCFLHDIHHLHMSYLIWIQVPNIK